MVAVCAAAFTADDPLIIDNAAGPNACLNAAPLSANACLEMQRKHLIIAAVLVPTVMVALALLSIDEPDFKVVDKTDGYELRRYQSIVVAETKVRGGFEEASVPAFKRLVDYIQGDNFGGRKMPMMAPVHQQSLTETTARGAGDQQADWLFQFVMPKEYQLSMVPKPRDDEVVVHQVPARTLAVRRYRGNWSEQRYRDNEGALVAAVEAAGLEPIGAPIFARYNAPFVPGFMRRNEVLLEVQQP